MSLSAKNFDFILIENQLLRMSIVSFIFAENNSARGLAFSSTKAAVAAALS